MPATEHQVERSLDADQARRALRAAAAGQQAQLNLGQTELGAGHGQPVVGRERDLQSAAERRAVDGGDHRLAAGLDAVADLGQRRRLRRLAELAHVGAGRESALAADQQDDLGLGIGLGLRHAIDDLAAQYQA